MPNPWFDRPPPANQALHPRATLRDTHPLLLLILGSALGLMAISSIYHLTGHYSAWRAAVHLESLHQDIAGIFSAGHLILRHRAALNAELNAEPAAPLAPQQNPVALHTEARRLLDPLIDKLPAASPLARHRDRWSALVSTPRPDPATLDNAVHALWQSSEDQLLALIHESRQAEGSLAAPGELRIATWHLRRVVAEEAGLTLRQLRQNTHHSPAAALARASAQARSEEAMYRLQNALQIAGKPAQAQHFDQLRRDYRQRMDAPTPRGSQSAWQTLHSDLEDLSRRYLQFTHLIDQDDRHHLAALRQQRQSELTLGIGEVLLELLLGIGLVLVLLHRVQWPLQRLQLALSGADGYFVDWNVAARTVDYAEGFDVMLGFAPGEIPRTVDGLGWLYHPDDRPLLNAAHRAAFHGPADRVDSELRIRRKGGGWHWIHIRMRVIERDHRQRAQRLIGVVQDVNARHLAEDEVQRLRQFDDAIFQASPVALLIARDHLILRNNPALETLLEREPGQLTGQPTRILFDSEADYLHTCQHIDQQLRLSPTFSFQATCLRSHSGPFIAHVHCSPLDAAAPDKGLIFAFHDHSAQHQLISQLDAASKRHRALFAALPNGVLILRRGIIIDCNPRLAELYGYRRDELIGQSSRLFFDNDSSWQQRSLIADPLLDSGRICHERQAVRCRDGSHLDVLVQGRWIDPGDHDQGAIFIHTPLNIEFDYIADTLTHPPAEPAEQAERAVPPAPTFAAPPSGQN